MLGVVVDYDYSLGSCRRSWDFFFVDSDCVHNFDLAGLCRRCDLCSLLFLEDCVGVQVQSGNPYPVVDRHGIGVPLQTDLVVAFAVVDYD